MSKVKFYDLHPGDRFIDDRGYTCTKVSGCTARMHTLEALKLKGTPKVCFAVVPPQALVEFIPLEEKK